MNVKSISCVVVAQGKLDVVVNREQRYRQGRQILAEIVVTPDGHVLARPEGAPGPLAHIAAEADLRANLSRLAMAAELDAAEWAEWAEFRALVKDRLRVVFPNGGGI